MHSDDMARAWTRADFAYDLPPDLIAAEPVTPRDHARLMQVTATAMLDKQVRDLPQLLRAGDVLVVNNTKVIPARLYGRRGTASIELLLHKKIAGGWRVFAKPAKRLRPGDIITIAADFSLQIIGKTEGGFVDLAVDEAKFFDQLQRYGEMPLPPYIPRAASQESDRTNYQTVYAKHAGAVAAPTAGLHLTPGLLETLKQQGVVLAELTLHVGAGTFLPVRVENIRDHVMHAEYGELSASTAALINQAKQQGGRVVAVGTTSLRLLESAATDAGLVQPFQRETDIFIYPGYQFRAVDMLMTNFHLPESTLLMLVSAFIGHERMQMMYAEAIRRRYRFYSYGDTSLLERHP